MRSPQAPQVSHLRHLHTEQADRSALKGELMSYVVLAYKSVNDDAPEYIEEFEDRATAEFVRCEWCKNIPGSYAVLAERVDDETVRVIDIGVSDQLPDDFITEVLRDDA